MNVSSWLKAAASVIASLDAELILLHVLQKEDRSFLYAHGDYLLTNTQLQGANELLSRRQRHEPLAYLVGYKEFYGRKFQVSPDVLIPRPETEAIIDTVKQIAAQAKNTSKLKILDVGTGSGCVITTLALELGDQAEYFACDISESALVQARQNAQQLGAQNIAFYQSDLLNNPQLASEKFDLIIANLPYVDPNWSWLDRETLAFEPALALYAEDAGLALIKKLLVASPSYLVKGGYLILEADLSQHEDITAFAAKFSLRPSSLYSADSLALPLILS